MAKPSEPAGGQDEQRIPHPCLADIPALPCRERPNQDCPYANGATNLHTKDTKIQQNGQAPAATLPGYKCKWTTNTIVHLLKNQEYTGCLVNFKTKKPSYKVKHNVENPIEKQAIF